MRHLKNHSPKYFAILTLLFFLFSMTACMTPGKRTTWVVDESNPAEVEKFMGIYNECKDFAYRAKVAGSKYGEHDIHMSCIQRKGYSMQTTSL